MIKKIIKGWRPAFTIRKARVRGDLGQKVLRTGVVFHNNSRVFVERSFRSGSVKPNIKIWGHGNGFHFEFGKVTR